MSNNNLAIKIKLQDQKPQAPEAKIRKAEKEVLWGRVVTAVGLPAIIVSSIGYGIYQEQTAIEPQPEVLAQTDTAPPAAVLEKSQTSSVKGTETLADSTTLTPIDNPSDKKLAQAEPQETPSSHASSNHDDVKPEVATEVTAERNSPQQALETETQTKTNVSTQEPPATTASLTTPAAQPAPVKVVASDAAPKEPAPANETIASETTASISQLSPNIVNTALSRTINKRLPGEPLTNTVTLGNERLIRVYFFSTYKNLKGKRVFHDWYLNNVRQASVKSRPNLESYRAHSSKLIDRNMTGQWEVRVRTENNTLLAKAHFRVER